MTASPDLLDVVRCPACRGPLSRDGDERLDCASCDAAFPVHDGVPWLYRDVPGSRAQWAAKLQQFRTDVLAERAELDAALADRSLLAATRERLSRQKAGIELLGEQVFKLLEPFALSHSEAGAEAASGLPVDRIPSQQHVASYLDTAFRDWCWGEEETRETMALADPLLPSLEEGACALVLGGGAGRFAWELARHQPAATVVQLDLNPLLTRIGAAVASGEALALTELPRFPLSVEDAVVDQRLARPVEDDAARPLYLLGDAFVPPFAEERFDLLVTPWFLDIVPEAFTGLSRRLSRLLAPGGRWLGFGPLSFEAQSPAARFTPEEMVDVLEAAGFVVEAAGTESVAYLHSPHGMPRRGEEIFVFAATRPAELATAEPFAFYPEWMTDPRVAIPDEPRWGEMRAERTFDVEILKCIDGRSSIEDLVVILSSRYGLAPDRCRNTINRFFSRVIEGEV